MDCSSCLRFGQACFLTTFESTPLANGGNLSKAQLKGLPKRLRALARPKSPFDETLLGLTIFLLSFPRARTPSKYGGDRKAFGYPGNVRYESIAAGGEAVAQSSCVSAGHRYFPANSQIDSFW